MEGESIGTYSLLQLGILSLDMNQIQEDVERPREDDRKEEGEASEVHVALRAEFFHMSAVRLVLAGTFVTH